MFLCSLKRYKKENMGAGSPYEKGDYMTKQVTYQLAEPHTRGSACTILRRSMLKVVASHTRLCLYTFEVARMAERRLVFGGRQSGLVPDLFLTWVQKG